MTDQASFICVSYAALNRVTGLDCDTISRKYPASRARDSRCVVMRFSALTLMTDIFQLVATTVVVVLVLRMS